MFRVLGSDFREFVSTLKEDATYIVDSVDDFFTEEGGDDPRDPTASSPVPARPVVDSDSSGHPPTKQRIEQERLRRMDDPSTYTQSIRTREVKIYTVPLHLANQDDGKDVEVTTVHEHIHPEGSRARFEVETYLDRFDLSEKTDEISRLLEDYDTSVGEHFSSLVPIEVSYDTFWKRFFYRCDDDRIARELFRDYRRRAVKVDTVAPISPTGVVPTVDGDMFAAAMRSIDFL